jgi:MoaA/NifB/PqqE/SkfB family radical SAM enzyme
MNISGRTGAQMAWRGMLNTIQNKPLTVSFEITHACTANCWHCNWGGPIKEKRLEPAEYGAIADRLKPVVVNISGGEPLARGDIYEILESVAKPGALPWIVVVTNASQLTPERFFRLKEAGMHQLSVSLDYPDDRHSDFRRIPGLFEKMSEVLPELARRSEKNDVSLNVCISAWNYRDLPDMVRLAKEWGLPINFSVYTHLRVQDRSGLVNGDGLGDIRRVIEEVIDMRRAGYPVYTTASTLRKFYRFLAEDGIPGCEAGRRFLVVNPDGRMTPCAMVMAYFDRQEDMLESFTKQNSCTKCYISTRANAEKSYFRLALDNPAALRRLIMPWRA